MKIRVKILFENVVDENFQIHFNEFDETFVQLHELVQNRFELLKHSADEHADFDERFSRLNDSFSSLERIFDEFKRKEFSADLFVEVQVEKTNRTKCLFFLSTFSFLFQNFQIDFDELTEEVQRLSSIENEILRQTSIDGGEKLKIKTKSFAEKFRKFSNEIRIFKVCGQTNILILTSSFVF